jgi:hypothetical protein
MAGIPAVTVEVAFDGGPFADTYTWTDVSPWVEGFSTRHGRNDELGQVEAGTLTLNLDNSDGRFTPGRYGRQLLPVNVTTGTEALGTTAGFTAGAGVTINAGTSNPHTGKGAVQILAPSTAGGISLIFTDKIPVTPGLTYAASYWIRKTTTAGNNNVASHITLRWRDSHGNFISDSNGTATDGSSSTWALMSITDVAPANATTATVIMNSTAAQASNWVYWLDDWSLVEVAPYYPNVLPRRRVRVRGPNLLPKDTSTGGDISLSSRNFVTFRSEENGNTSQFVTDVAKSGAGAIRHDLRYLPGGTDPFGASLYCGYVETITYGGATPGEGDWTRIRFASRGLARIKSNTVYTGSGSVRLGSNSPADAFQARIRWFDSSLTYLGASVAAPFATSAGAWLPFSVTDTAPAGAAYAGLQIGSAGTVQGVYAYVDELQLEEGPSATSWVPGGSIFSGFIEKWPVSTAGLTASVSVTATDGFSILGTTELQRPMRQHILSSVPWGYWPLTDAAGPTVQNLADSSKPGRLWASKYGGATAAFGAPSIVANDDGTAYSLTNVSATAGTVVDVLSGGQRAFSTLDREFSVSFWTLPTRPSSGTTATLFSASTSSGGLVISVTLDSSGNVVASFGQADGGGAGAAGGPVLSTSKPTLISVVVLEGVVTLYFNGVSVTQGVSNSLTPDLAQPRYMVLAGDQTSGRYQNYASGRFGHLAVWDRALGDDEVAAIADLGTAPMGAAYGEAEDDRLYRLATFANFRGEVVADSGVSTLHPPAWDTSALALGEIQSTAAAASGYVFMDGDGRLTYHARSRRQSAAIRYTLSDTLGLPYESDLDFIMDEDSIVNEVTFTRPDGVQGVVRDDASIAAYGRRSKSITVNVDTDAQASDAANAVLNPYSDPIVRCDSITFRATATPALFPLVLGVEMGDKIRLADLPVSAPSGTADFYVESVQTDVVVNGPTPEWTTNLALSPASASDVWVLEDDLLGILDVSTSLAW